MGTLTLTELQSEVQDAHGTRIDFDEAKRIIALNIAQMRIARLQTWNELQVIYSGTVGQSTPVPATDKYVDIPSDIRQIYSFKIVDTTSKQDSKKLEFVQQRLWDRTIPESEAWDTGKPSHYTIWDKRFELWKIPDKQYNSEVRAAKWPTQFVSTSPNATSDLDQKDDMIVALANSWGFLKFREMEEANRWFSVFKDMYRSAEHMDIAEFENEVKPGVEQFLSGSGNGTGSPWADPFNRTGVE